MKPYRCRVHGYTQNFYESTTTGARRCRACHVEREDSIGPRERTDYMKAWNKSDHGRKIDMTRRRKDKAEVLRAYGGKCVCCGEMNEAFLTIDHVGDNGAAHRREAGEHIYQWLRLHDFPKDAFRLMCLNCNRGRWINGGECPHRSVKPLSAQIVRYGFIGRREPFREALTAGG